MRQETSHGWGTRYCDGTGENQKGSWVDAVQGASEGDSFADVVQAADPGDDAFDAHAEAGVRHAAVAAQVEIPVEGFQWQVVGFNAALEQVVAGDTLRAADDFAVTFGGENVKAES